ncbi:SctJ family type III secretion inner membrane ring lipoprotein Bsc [Variovorax defluvii]|uniref:Lipoprotein n=1 Tax=Variovorax defluvii TaxID=913761 RepID=A0ABP8HZW9_9BURK
MHTILRALICALAACVLAGCEGSVQLFANLNERDANEVLASLKEAGIDARKLPGKEGINLEVSQPVAARAIEHLNAEGLPRERRSNMGDVFRKEGLISSPLEERARYLWALSQELSETISQIDGIVRARVHVVLPERSAGSDPAMPSSAAVFVKHRRSVHLEESIPQIRRLVASSIPGLQIEKVTVVLVPTGPRASGVDAGTQRANASPTANGGNGTMWAWWVSPLAGGLLASCILAGVAFATWRKRRKAPAIPDAQAPVPAAEGDAT